jgi:hypothetical protein
MKDLDDVELVVIGRDVALIQHGIPDVVSRAVDLMSHCYAVNWAY